MSDAPRLLQLVALPAYERAAKGVLSQDDERNKLRKLAAILESEP
jgi:hypothetical protein